MTGDFEPVASAAADVVTQLTTKRMTAARRLFIDPDECCLLDQRAIDFLLKARVAVLDGVTPSPSIGGCRVVFHPNCRYTPNRIGDFAFVIPAFANDVVVDAVAWCPRTGQLGSRFGRACMLGEDDLRRDGAGTTGLAIWVFRDPLGWLRAGRKGIVIVDEDPAALALSGRFLRAEDDDHVRELRKRLHIRNPIILGPSQATRAAA